jgi:hypothetical protein
VVDVCKDGVLGYNVIHLAQLNDVCLLQPLHREELSVLFVFGQKHSTERP